jgi:hypothetical protein
MGKVVAIHRRPTRPPGCERALALMIEAQSILIGLVANEQIELGSPPEVSIYYLADAIGMLTPFTPEEEREFGAEDRKCENREGPFL